MNCKKKGKKRIGRKGRVPRTYIFKVREIWGKYCQVIQGITNKTDEGGGGGGGQLEGKGRRNTEQGGKKRTSRYLLRWNGTAAVIKRKEVSGGKKKGFKA